MAALAGHPFRLLPLTPPDTDHDLSHMTPATGHYPGATPERTRYQPRRTSALSYQNSGARDPRDRAHARGPRNLVVVIPPPDFPLDQRQLGNVSSMGPRHRLSQGILMPLFPSMLGQLNAIAREYNFPSTVGLCLYLQVHQNGIALTPRISDDSWQYLFGHLFEGRPSSGHQLPIGGSIEFDIDLSKARWFEAWATGTLRELDPGYPPVVLDQESFGAHWRVESQTTNADEQPAEERWDTSGSHTLVTDSRPETLRHPPRRLSLVDRLDSHGLQVPLKSQNHPNGADYLPPSHQTHALSPIPQSAIPRAAKFDLEHRVNSWRAATDLNPVSMAETYQPAPDSGVSVGAGVTTMDEYALERNFRKAVDNDEYLWALTSMGPRSPVMESPIASSPPFSVHLDRRVNGTIPLTPTTMSSWGPTDDDRNSNVSSVSQIPSPDIEERMVEDIMAPRRCAVWGNSFGWRSATTWKEVYPYSATQTKPTSRVQLQDSNNRGSQYLDLVIYQTVGSCPDAHFLFDVFGSSSRSVWGSSFGWRRAVTWRKVYPYSMVTTQSVAPIQPGVERLVSEYPNLCVYPAVYPCFDIYPACTVEEKISQSVSVMLGELRKLITSYPNLMIYPAVYPHLGIYPSVVDDGEMKEAALMDTIVYSLDGALASYPNFVIYPAVYPHFDLYPKASQISQTFRQEIDVRLVKVSCLTAEYPDITIYPSVLGVYSTRDARFTSSVVWGISFGWLTAKTWLQVYPLHTATPMTNRLIDAISKSWGQSLAIASIVVGKRAVWGSSFGWDSAATWRAVWPTSCAQIRPNVSSISAHFGWQSGPSSYYPYLVIYPVTYPHIDVYPPCTAVVEVEVSQMTKNGQSTINLISRYPNIVIYPEVYPYLDVYPAFARASIAVEHGKGQFNLRRRRIEIWRAKTAAQVELADLIANNHEWEVDEPLQLNLADYAWSRTSAGPPTPPSGLPHTPYVPGSIHIDRRVSLTPSTATTWGPQDDNQYSDAIHIERLPSPDLGQRVLDDIDGSEPPHQPWHTTWISFGSVGLAKNLSSVLEPEYPHLNIYPPAYPHFELYPTWTKTSTLKIWLTEILTNSTIYPTFNIYPVIYPYFNIYPRTAVPSKVVSNVRDEQVEVRLPCLYPNFDIYRACYPYNLDHIYPLTGTAESTQTLIGAPRGYPWLVVYSPVYPFIIPYPGSSAEIGQPFRPEQILSTFLSMEWNQVSMTLPAQYPTLDLYPPSYPLSLERIYPAVSVNGCSEVAKPQYPCIWIYPPVYPFVQPYPGGSDSVHMPGTLDEDEDRSAETFLALLETKRIDPESVVYPYFELYPTAPMLTPQETPAPPDAYFGDLATHASRIPVITRRNPKTHSELHELVFGSSGKRSERNSKVRLQLHVEALQGGMVWTPSEHVPGRTVQDTDVGDLATPLPRADMITQRKRKTHMELHASVFRSLGKQPARNTKTHVQLHTEVLRDDVVRTPNGYMEETLLQTKKKPGDIQVQKSQRRPSQDGSTTRPPRSGLATNTTQSSDKVAFPLGHPPTLPPLSPLRVRSPGIPPQPPLAVSETPLLRIPSPSVTYTHRRTASSRLTQVVRSMMPGLQRHGSSATPENPPPEDNKEHVREPHSPTRFLSLIDRRSRVVAPLPHTSTSEFLTRAPPSSQRKESLVLQRARAYEQATVMGQSSGTIGNEETHTPFTLPPLPPIPPMTDVAEALEKSTNISS